MPSGGAGVWQQARASARTLRAALLEGELEREIPADQILRKALAAAGLRCYPRRPNDPLLSGAHAVLDAEARAVWVRSDAPPAEGRVYIAHELGHFHLHESGGEDAGCLCDEHDLAEDNTIQSVGYGPRQRRETEANVWAREFLLPVPLVRRLFYEEGREARQIADHLVLPLPVVLAQLSEALSPSSALFPGNDATEKQSWPLDPSQEAAARAERGPLLVGAGPGTGKTRTLTARVLYLTREQGVKPENILALTFSRKAAEEMRERIAAQAPEVARRAAISTFHAYGLDLLRRHGRAAGLPPNPILLDSVDACALLERRASSLGLSALRYLHDPAFPLPEILRAIGRAKEELVTPEAFAQRAEETDDDKLRDVARVYSAYEALLREKGALDFPDLVCRALRLLQENEAVRWAEQSQWKHILVDEYQDVNRAGALLVQALAGETAEGLWAVGDLRQAIYRFRGASPANVARFSEDFPGGRRLDLAVNYRSRPKLVSLFGAACGEGSAAWQSSRSGAEDTTISLVVAPTDTAQADGIATRMRAFVEAGYRFDDMVALCRTRSQARALRAQLTARGIPIAPGPDENNLLGRRDIRDLLTLLARVAEPGGPARYRLPDPPSDLLYVGGDALDLWTEALWGSAGWARRITDGEAVQRLLALAQTFRERAAFVLEEEDDPRRAFLAHIRRMARMGASFGEVGGGETNVETDALRVLTVHASKGLEFPVVFVPNLSAGKFPSRPAPSLLPELSYGEGPATDVSASDQEMDEEARLFFVALSRARDHLILSRAEKYNNRSAAPSPLLACLETAAEVRQERWEEGERVVPPLVSSPPSREEREEAEVLAVREAWEAELYLRCPRRYFYERVAEVSPGDRTAYSAFKRAVEMALEEENPRAALETNWVAYGPEPSHPHASLYREAAEQTVARAATPGRNMPSPPRDVPLRRLKGPVAPSSQPASHSGLSLPLENGVVMVRADATDEEGRRMECQTFRKPPQSGDAEASTTMRLSLLYEAAARANPGAEVSVHLRYLQTGDTFPVADKPKQREKHLAAYDRALKGIRLKVYDPAPTDAGDCPTCPYFFICPD